MSFLQKIINKVGLKRWIENQNYIGSQVLIGENTVVKGSNISGRIDIGHNCKIYRADLNGNIEIGNFTSIWGPNVDLNALVNGIKIGNYCSIAKNVTFQEFNHNHSRFTTYYINKNILKNKDHKSDLVSKGSILVEHDVWIGAHSVVLSGAHISTGAIVAANSVVTGFVPPYAIVGGTPAKIIKSRFEPEVCAQLLESRWWDLPPNELKNRIDEFQEIVKNTNA